MRDEVRPQLTDPALRLLYEVAGLPREQLPPPLAELYGGELGFRRPVLYANFVSTLDGITAIDPEAPGQGAIISGGLPADRFLMGLLRAFADVVLIGAGTLRAEPKHVWTADRVHPGEASAFAALRQLLGLAPKPPLAVVTATGDVGERLPGLAGGVVLTTTAGRATLSRLPADVRVIALGDGPRVDLPAAVEALRELGFRSILTEGGPHLFGLLLAAGLVDELFLTLSPRLAGREPAGSQVGLVEGISLLPNQVHESRLLSARRSGSHLFLRYDLTS